MERREQEWEQHIEESEVKLERKPRNQNKTITKQTSNDFNTNYTQKVDENLSEHNIVVDEVKVNTNVEGEQVEGSFEECVYYDDDKGIWKCRFCCWAYGSGSVCIDHIQNPNQHLHMLMNVKTVNQQGPCVISETKGTEFTNGNFVTEHNSIEFSGLEKIPENSGLDVTVQISDNGKSSSTITSHQDDEILKNKTLHVSSLHPSEISEISFEEENTSLDKIPEDNGLDVTVQSSDNNGKSSSIITNHQDEEIKILPVSSLHPSEISEISFVENTSYETFSNRAKEGADINLTREIKDEIAELDVERVLEKQDTHDLFCPNCNSCITGRVILRKRKRRIPTADEDTKRNKLDAVIDSDLGAISADQTGEQARDLADIDSYGTPPPAASDNDRDRDIFGCFSCFSIFIPTGNGFKLFRMSKNKSEMESIEGPRQTQAMKKSWFSSIFSSDKEVIKQGLLPSSNLNGQNGEVSSLHEPLLPAQKLDDGGPATTGTSEPQANGNIVLHSSTEQQKIEKLMVDIGEKLDDTAYKSKDGAYSEISQHNTTRTKANIHTEKPLKVNEDVQVSSVQDSSFLKETEVSIGKYINDGSAKSNGVTFTETSTKMDIHVEKSYKVDTDATNSSAQDTLLIQSGLVTSGKDIMDMHVEKNADGAYPSQTSQNDTVTTQVDIHIEKSSNVDKNIPVSAVKDALLIQEELVDLGKRLMDVPAKAGKDTIITVGTGQVESAASPIAENIMDPIETGDSPSIETRLRVLEQRAAMGRKVHGIDIIKSIVYGGLIESITSLGVVSSAAGANAATLNVLALGLANLIGGLFVIGHDLWEVKNSQTGGASDQVGEQVDRYQELLGKREDFPLHAFVAILSYLIFGLLPPVIFGFSFRVSNDRDFKLIAVAVASLLCIIILATGKAYARRPPKSYIKTIMYYIIMVFTVSGVSYAAGSLIMKFLEKLGLFDSPSVVTMQFADTRSMKPAWASY